MPAQTAEVPKGAKLISKLAEYSRRAITRTHKDIKTLGKPGEIKVVSTEELEIRKSEIPEKGNLLYTSLEFSGVPEESRPSLFVHSEFSVYHNFSYWSRSTNNPKFYLEEALSKGLSSDDLHLRARAAATLGMELVRYNLSGAAPIRNLTHDIWPGKVKEGLDIHFFPKVQDKLSSDGLDKLNGTRGLIANLLDHGEGRFYARGALLVFAMGEGKTPPIEFRFNQSTEDATLTTLAEDSQKMLLTSISSELGLPLDSLVKSNFINSRELPKIRRRTLDSYREYRLARKPDLFNAYINSRIPEHIEGLV